MERSLGRWLARRGITVLIYAKGAGGTPALAPVPAAAAPSPQLKKSKSPGSGSQAAAQPAGAKRAAPVPAAAEPTNGNDTESMEDDVVHQPAKVQRKNSKEKPEEKKDEGTAAGGDPDGTQPLSDSEQPPKSIDPEDLPDLPALEGVVLVFDMSISAAHQADIRDAATSLGAKFNNKWMPRGLAPTTHLIAITSGSETVSHIERLGGWIDWVFACKAKNVRLEEDKYTLNAPPIPTAAPPAAPAPKTALKPAKALASKPAAASSGSADLADVFTSVKVHFMNLPKGVLDPVKRYFIAHNGDLASSAQDATHIVTEPPWTAELDAILKTNKGVKIVIPDWVIESTKSMKQLPERPYFVERKK